MRLLPRDVKRALDLMRADPARERSIGELAAACGVARRTLQKHFRRFLGRSPRAVLHELRLELVRRELLRAPADANVTEIVLRCGITHLGRFAALYRDRYGETPSTTIRRRRYALAPEHRPRIAPSALDRPVIAVLPFDRTGAVAYRGNGMAEEIIAELLRNRWLAVGAPGRARYLLRGWLRDDGTRLRVTAMLSDAATGRHLWAERWDGALDDLLEFEMQLAADAAVAVGRVLRVAEVERARSAAQPSDAWTFTMRALPLALQIEAGAQAEALELLGQAMELAPHDALPVALAAWCHGQRAGHYFTANQAAERRAARVLALRAAQLNGGDAKAETLIGAAHTLTHDLEAAAPHFDRALALDGGCVWAWNRSGWLNVYRGRPADAIECFQIARSIGPDDPLDFFCSLGTATAHFEAGRFAIAADWFARGVAKHPQAVWANRFRAPALVLCGRREEARHCFVDLRRAYPELTIAAVRAALPHTARFYDHISDGLESLGMRL